MRYARADIDLKHQMLAQVFPDGSPRLEAADIDQADIVGWLRRI